MDLLNNDQIQESLKKIKENEANYKAKDKINTDNSKFEITLSPGFIKQWEALMKLQNEMEMKLFYGSGNPTPIKSKPNPRGILNSIETKPKFNGLTKKPRNKKSSGKNKRK